MSCVVEKIPASVISCDSCYVANVSNVHGPKFILLSAALFTRYMYESYLVKMTNRTFLAIF